jgi:hypothetical protein
VFIADRMALLAAARPLLPMSPPGAVLAISTEEPDKLALSVGTRNGGVRSSALGRVVLAGRVLVPLRPLVRALSCGTGSCRVEVAGGRDSVVVVVDPDGLTARRFTFEAGEAGDLPPTPELGADRTAAEMPAAAFQRLVARTAYTVAMRSATVEGWATAALQLGIGAGRVTAAATDGIRLATAAADAETTSRRAARAVLVPVSAARGWAKLAPHAETVKLTLGSAFAAFAAGTVSAWSSVLTGAFPAWRDGALELPHTMTVPVARLTAELDAALAVAGRDDPRLLISAKRGALVIGAASGRSRGSFTVPCPTGDSPPVEVFVDGVRLREILGAYRGEQVLTLSYSTSAEPIALSVDGARTLLAPHCEEAVGAKA